MRLDYFFVDQKLPGEGEVTIVNIKLLHQWRQVLRFSPGQRVVLLDDSGFEFEAHVVSLKDLEARVRIVRRVAPLGATPRFLLTFYLSLLKKDKFEWVLQKCTELGVSRFVPILAEHSEKRTLDVERARKIIREAAEQSHRVILPEILVPLPLDTILASAHTPLFVLDPSGSSRETGRLMMHTPAGIAVGPEGGWSEAEHSLFSEKNIPLVSLGHAILRAETAAVAAAALLLCANLISS